MKKLLIILILAFWQLTGLQAQSGIYGYVVYDADFSCTYSAGDSFISDAIIEAIDSLSTNKYYGNTARSTGEYSIQVPQGNYTVSAQLPYQNPYFSFCQNNIPSIVNTGTTDTVFFYVQPTVLCPLLHVDIGSDGIPECGQSKYYIRYENLGTVGAPNTFVDLSLDSFTTINSSSIPSTAMGNNVYRFNIGYLGLGRDSMQVIEVDVSVCGGIAGQAHCAKANIYPNNICGNIWPGAILETEVVSFSDSVLFRIRNNGGLSMLASTRSSIVIDDLMYAQPFIGPLNPGQTDSIWVPTSIASSYRFEIPQDSSMPKLVGGPVAWSAIEGANPDSLGLFNVGHLTKFYTDNQAVSEAYDCQENQANLVYNRKIMQTKGYGSPRYIMANTPLEYQIRFQNLTPTIGQFVDIYDTLDAGIDIKSLHVGAVSHQSYTIELSGTNVLHIQFPFINLVPNIQDSTLSHGFINLHFDQKPELPLGTVIENRAMIIINNFDTTYTANIFNTIGENFIVFVSNEVIYQPKASVRVYPNPMIDIANYEVSGIDYKHLTLEIYSTAGQLIQQVQGPSDSILQVQRNDLSAGLYFYRLLADGEQIDAGKVMVR